jgi:hypothetical protein
MNLNMVVEVVIAGASVLDMVGIPAGEDTWVEEEVITPIPLVVKSTLETSVFNSNPY